AGARAGGCSARTSRPRAARASAARRSPWPGARCAAGSAAASSPRASTCGRCVGAQWCCASGFGSPTAGRSRRGGSTTPARSASPDRLVSPPVAPSLDVFTRSLAEIGRADDEDLEALRPGLVAPPRTGRDAHRVPLLERDDLVVELHPPAPAQDHVHLLLRPVRVAVRKAVAGRDALVAQ